MQNFLILQNSPFSFNATFANVEYTKPLLTVCGVWDKKKQRQRDTKKKKIFISIYMCIYCTLGVRVVTRSDDLRTQGLLLLAKWKWKADKKWRRKKYSAAITEIKIRTQHLQMGCSDDQQRYYRQREAMKKIYRYIMNSLNNKYENGENWIETLIW